jgi:hypothetical protein
MVTISCSACVVDLTRISCSAWVADLTRSRYNCSARVVDLTRSAVLHHTRGLNKKISCSAWVVDLTRISAVLRWGKTWLGTVTFFWGGARVRKGPQLSA